MILLEWDCCPYFSFRTLENNPFSKR